MSFGDAVSSTGRGSGVTPGGASRGFAGANTSYQKLGDGAEHERLLSVVTNNVQQMQYNVTRLNTMVRVLGTDKDTKDHRNKLRQTIDTTRDLAKDTNEAFKKLSVAHADNPAVRLVARRRRTDARAQKAKLVHDRLRKDFETWLKEYQEVSKLSVQKERESQPRPDPDDAAVFKGLGAGPDAGLSSGMPGMGGHYSEQEEAQLEAQRIAEERRTKFQQLEQQREIERALIEERDKGIRDIEASVVTVNEIFQDLATLVEEQGEMIENIESNIQKTDVNTKEGVAELRKANSYQKSSRTKLCILLLCIVLLCGAVAGGYFLFKPKE